MYLIVTRSFPPEIGGMQNLMWGLANELSKTFIKLLMNKFLFQ
jgi:phosphatidylinositol alpha-1,6-mannosyltransferase